MNTILRASRALPAVLVAAAALLALGGALGDAGRGAGWWPVLLLATVLAALLFATRRPRRSPAARDAARLLRDAVAFAALILVIASARRLAAAAGLTADAEFAARLTMVVLGLFFAATGNVLPKMLVPLPASRCSPGRAQALRRFAGWAWVLSGLAFAGAWLTLPAAIAEPASLACLAAGAVTVAGAAAGSRRTDRPLAC